MKEFVRLGLSRFRKRTREREAQRVGRNRRRTPWSSSSLSENVLMQLRDLINKGTKNV
jgi:hypothetical protein